jgi:hypothetical protein
MINTNKYTVLKATKAAKILTLQSKMLHKINFEKTLLKFNSFLFLGYPHNLPYSQFFPFSYYAADIFDQFRLKVVYSNITDFDKKLNKTYPKVKIIGFQTWFDFSAKEFDELHLKLKITFPNAKLVYFDWFATTDLRVGEILGRKIDVYVKKNTLSPLSQYSNGHKGDTTLMDYFAKVYSIKYEYKKYQIDNNFLKKIITGPNFNTAPYLQSLFHQNPSKIFKHSRQFDLHARFATDGSTWYSAMRKASLKAVNDINDIKTVSSGRVKFRQYLEEISNSKMTFSPFGYGEVCWRDYEATALGSLLIKPCMDHIATSPDIFIANETYVPINWDFSDLNEKIIFYLENKAERDRITKNAFEVGHNYTRNDAFLDFFKTLLAKLNYLGPYD